MTVVYAGIALALATISVVNVLRGKYWFALFVWLPALLPQAASIAGAVRIAKPESWWARRFYVTQAQKMNEAMERFPGQAIRVDPGWRSARPDQQWRYEAEPVNEQDSEPWDDEDLASADRITHRALRKKGRA